MNQTRLHLLLLAFLVLLWAQPGLAAPKKKAAQVHPSFYMDQGYTVLTGRPSVAIWGQMISMAECSLYEVPYSGPDEPADAEKIASHPLPVRHWTQSLGLGKKYGQKRIYLPVTRQGTYRLVIRAGPFRSQKTFRYSLLGMIVKQAPGQLLVLVEDMLKQATARDARVEVKRVYHMTRVVKKGKKTRTIRWDRTETVYRGKPGLLSLDLSGEFTVAAVRGGDFVRYREDLGAKERSFKVYVYTDRPIYRPKGVVHFRGILRELTAGRYTIPVGSVQVEVRDSQDGVLYKKTLTLTPFGSFSDHLALPEEVPLGDCSIVTTIDNKAHYQPFSVGEYRKPEFQVEVVPDRKHLTMGEDLVFRVRSSYYFGGPVSDGKVYYQIRAYTRYFDTWERSEEEAWAEEAEASHRSHGEEFVKEGEVRLSETGEALVTVPSMKHKSEKIYQIQATVTDASSRTAKGSASVDVTRGEFLLGALCDRFAYGKGETVSVKLLARDLDGKPVSTPVKIQVDLEKWAPRGSTYPNVLTGETVLNDKGEGVFAFQAPRSGYFRITAEAHDSKDHPISAETYAWVSGSEPYVYSYPELEILADKRVYQPGEQARILIHSSVKDALCLLSVEGEKIHSIHRIPIKNGSAEFLLPITGDFMPNIYVAAAIPWAGRLVQGSRVLPVPARDKFLSVQILPDRSEYKPGETASYQIITRDSSGKPASSEVSLGLVDAAIYALRREGAPDIRRFFWGTRENKVFTGFSIPTELSAGGVQKVEAPVEIRRKFLDTAFWDPRILTDEKGEATVSVPLPDNITTWRATARGVTMETLVGQGTKDVLARKKVMVRLLLPRFAVQDDEITFSAIVHNQSERIQGSEISLEAPGIALDSPESVKVEIPAGGTVKRDWKGRIQNLPPQGSSFRITAIARGDDSDGVELPLPILVHGAERRAFLSGRTFADISRPFSAPPSLIPESGGLTVSLSPSLMGPILESLEYLATYPYGCTEQTMSSFLPDIAVWKTLKEMGIRNEKLEKELPKMVKTGLKRLYDYQHPDGGWGWWESDATNPYLTAYVVWGLNLAREAGISVDSYVLRRGMESSRSLLSREKDLKARTLLLYASLSDSKLVHAHLDQVMTANTSLEREIEHLQKRMDRASQADRQDLEAKIGNLDNQLLDTYSMALLAEMYGATGQKSKALRILRELKARAIGGAFWEGRHNRYGWTDNGVEVTAVVVRAFLKSDPGNEVVDRALQWLSGRRRGKAWDSTKDTVAALLTFLEAARGTRELSPRFKAQVFVNGKPSGEASFEPGDAAKTPVRLFVPLGDLQPGENVLEIRKSGEGRLYYSASLEAFEKVDRIRAQSWGFRIVRHYHKKVATQREFVPLEPSLLLSRIGKRDKPVDVTISEGKLIIRDPALVEDLKPMVKNLQAEGEWKTLDSGPLSVGDEIQVDLEVVADANYSYVIVEDHRPAGFEILETPMASTTQARREDRDRKVAFFVGHLPKGTHRFAYRMRVETPGRLTALPAKAELMYLPEVRGNSEEASFEVLSGSQ